MAYSRSRRSTTYGEFWPGYVDVLSTLLLVVTFLMSVFMVSQFYVSQEAAGKDTALRRLTRQIAEITNLLSLEKGKSKSVEDELASLQASLATLRADNEKLTGLAGLSGDSQARISALGARLNVVLARQVQELQRYRSDFFGRLRELLKDRKDIRVVGD